MSTSRSTRSVLSRPIISSRQADMSCSPRASITLASIWKRTHSLRGCLVSSLTVNLLRMFLTRPAVPFFWASGSPSVQTYGNLYQVRTYTRVRSQTVIVWILAEYPKHTGNDNRCTGSHPIDGPWYQQTIPQWFYFLVCPTPDLSAYRLRSNSVPSSPLSGRSRLSALLVAQEPCKTEQGASSYGDQ